MNSFKLIVVIVFVVFYLTACKNNSNDGLQTKIFPQDNVLTFVSADEKNVELCFELFASNEDSGFIKENIEDIYISADGVNNIPVTVSKTVQHSKLALDDNYIYRTSFTVLINRDDSEDIENSYINIKLKGDEQYTMYELGSIAFINGAEDERIRKPLVITGLAPINTEINGVTYTVGLICELDVAASITINSFDMKLSDYGLDKLYVIDKDYDQVVLCEDRHELNELISDIYNTENVTIPSYNTESVNLDKGIYTAIIKLNMTQNAKALASLGCELGYIYLNENYSACYGGYKKETTFNYSEDMLKKTIYKEYFAD